CPSEQALHDEVAIRMGYDPFTPDAPDRIVATLKHSPRGFTATVERFDSKDVPQWEPQTYPSSNCAELVMAMGVYISEMFRPHVASPEPLSPSPSAALSPAPPEVEQPPAPVPVPSKVEPPPPHPSRPPLPTPPRRLGGHVAASGGPSFGAAPADLAARI